MARFSDPFAPLGSNILGGGAELADYCVFTITDFGDDLWADASHTARLSNLLYDSRAASPTKDHLLLADGLTNLAAKSGYQILAGSNRDETITGLWTFRPGSGLVPFAVPIDRKGTVDNLSAQMLEGRRINFANTGNSVPDPDSVAVYDSNGRLSAEHPSGDHHVVTKGYLAEITTASYLHVQDIPARDWVVYHGLGKALPTVAVEDDSGNRLMASAFASTLDPLNEVVIHHATPQTGRCRVIA